MATKKAAPKKGAAKGAKAAKPAAKAPAKKAMAAKKGKSAPPKKAPAAKKPVAKAAVKQPAKKAAVKVAPPKKIARPAAKAPVAPMKKAPVKGPTPAPAPAKKPHVAPPPPAQHVEPVKKPSVAAPSKEEVRPSIKPIENSRFGPRPVPKPEPPKPARVPIPKTSTTASVKYQPDFTKSVLDTHQQESNGPTMRYSDVELNEFKELINRKLDTAKKELAYLQGLITRKDESGDLDEGRYMTMEDGSMSMEREQLSQMASRQITFIDHLEKAIMRIENKTYGICRVTGKLIDKARLRAVPHATLSIEAKQMMNK